MSATRILRGRQAAGENVAVKLSGAQKQKISGTVQHHLTHCSGVEIAKTLSEATLMKNGQHLIGTAKIPMRQDRRLTCDSLGLYNFHIS